MTEPDFSLREKKYAKTKLALMQAFIRRMEIQRFDDISIKEICAGVMVSEGTFFNYFPSKIDVIFYFAQLYNLRAQCETLQKAKPGAFLDRIDVLFEVMADNFPNPHVIYEIISVAVREKTEPTEIEISPAERYYAFPDCEGILEVKSTNIFLHEFIKECLDLAVQNNELPADADAHEIMLSLKALMVGLPLAVKYENYSSVKEHYRKQLDILWKGYGRKIAGE